MATCLMMLFDPLAFCYDAAMKNQRSRMVGVALLGILAGAIVTYAMMQTRLKSEWAYETKLQDRIRSLELR